MITLFEDTEEVREELAAYAHRAWSGWMRYLFGKSRRNKKGQVIIPKWAVDRWYRQLIIPYENLSEEEKDSDRQEADKFIAIIS